MVLVVVVPACRLLRRLPCAQRGEQRRVEGAVLGLVVLAIVFQDLDLADTFDLGGRGRGF